MDDSLYFSKQHLDVRDMVREFALSDVKPVAAKHDADATFPWENIRKMGELGLLGIPWEEELGGAGMDLLCYMIVILELAKVDASHGLTVSAHTTLGTSPIVRFGTEAQKRAYVPLLASGKIKPVIHQTFTLEDASAAHRLMEADLHTGKLVLTI